MSGIYKGPDGQDLFGDDYEVPSGAVIYTPAPQPEGPSALESLAAIGVASQDAIALRAEVVRLTAELAAVSEERAQARHAFSAAVLGKAAAEHALARVCEERDGLAAALEKAPTLAVEAIVDYCRVANRRCGIELQDAVVLQMQQALSDPAAILARIKAEGLRRIIADMENKGAQMITIATLRRIAKEESSATV
jgi:hypothetical protein